MNRLRRRVVFFTAGIALNKKQKYNNNFIMLCNIIIIIVFVCNSCTYSAHRVGVRACLVSSICESYADIIL